MSGPNTFDSIHSTCLNQDQMFSCLAEPKVSSNNALILYTSGTTGQPKGKPSMSLTFFELSLPYEGHFAVVSKFIPLQYVFFLLLSMGWRVSVGRPCKFFFLETLRRVGRLRFCVCVDHLTSTVPNTRTPMLNCACLISKCRTCW